jgi:hypothetical protein
MQCDGSSRAAAINPTMRNICAAGFASGFPKREFNFAAKSPCPIQNHKINRIKDTIPTNRTTTVIEPRASNLAFNAWLMGIIVFIK